MKLDTIYSEQNEAKFIRETFALWQSLKKEIYKIIQTLEYNYEKDDTSKKSSYLD